MGVGTIDEVVSALDSDAKPDRPSLFRSQIEALLARSRGALERLARTSDATKAEIDEAQAAHREAREKAGPAIALFDLITAHRDGRADLPESFDEEGITALADADRARSAINKRQPLHFPAAFPEVFLRDRPGFDCLVGNPPWDEVTVDNHKWWGLHIPGLMGMDEGDKRISIANLKGARPDLVDSYDIDILETDKYRGLLRKSFPNLGSGDTDLSKAFSWRNWHLNRAEGYVGLVLPRGLLMNDGSKEWRKSILDDGIFTNVVMMINTNGWVFPDIHKQYIVSLVSFAKRTNVNPVVGVTCLVSSRDNFKTIRPELIPLEEFRGWSTNDSYPNLPEHSGAARLFSKLRRHTTIAGRRQTADSRQQTADSLLYQTGARNGCNQRQAFVYSGQRCIRPVAELHATNDKHRFILDAGRSAMSGSNWPVYGGKSFNIWNPDTGKYYASVDPNVITVHLHKKRQNQSRTKTSPFYGRSDIENVYQLPCYRPRIAFRLITNAVDTRSLYVSLVPPKVILTNAAPYLLQSEFSTSHDEAYVLGVLSSMICDWYLRRVVGLNLNMHIFNNIPIPDSDTTTYVRYIANRVSVIAGTLAAVDGRFSDWAAEVGVPVGTATDDNPEYKQALIEELDACVALLYGLDEDDLACLYETFHETTDYSDRHQAVLAHFRRLASLSDDSISSDEL